MRRALRIQVLVVSMVCGGAPMLSAGLMSVSDAGAGSMGGGSSFGGGGFDGGAGSMGGGSSFGGGAGSMSGGSNFGGGGFDGGAGSMGGANSFGGGFDATPSTMTGGNAFNNGSAFTGMNDPTSFAPAVNDPASWSAPVSDPMGMNGGLDTGMNNPLQPATMGASIDQGTGSNFGFDPASAWNNPAGVAPVNMSDPSGFNQPMATTPTGMGPTAMNQMDGGAMMSDAGMGGGGTVAGPAALPTVGAAGLPAAGTPGEQPTTPLGIPTFNESFGVQDLAQGIESLSPGLMGEGPVSEASVNSALGKLDSDQLRTLMPGMFGENHRVGAKLNKDGTMDTWMVVTAGNGHTTGDGAVALGQRMQESNPELAAALTNGGQFLQSSVPGSDLHLGANVGFAPGGEGEKPSLRLNGATIYLGDLPKERMGIQQDGRVWVGAGGKEATAMIQHAQAQSSEMAPTHINQNLPLGNKLRGTVTVGGAYVTDQDSIVLPVNAHVEARKTKLIGRDRVTSVNASAYPELKLTDQGDSIGISVDGNVNYGVSHQRRVAQDLINNLVAKEVPKATQGAVRDVVSQVRAPANAPANDPRHVVTHVQNNSRGNGIHVNATMGKAEVGELVFKDRDMTFDSLQVHNGRVWAAFSLPNGGKIMLPQ